VASQSDIVHDVSLNRPLALKGLLLREQPGQIRCPTLSDRRLLLSRSRMWDICAVTSSARVAAAARAKAMPSWAHARQAAAASATPPPLALPLDLSGVTRCGHARHFPNALYSRHKLFRVWQKHCQARCRASADASAQWDLDRVGPPHKGASAPEECRCQAPPRPC